MRYEPDVVTKLVLDTFQKSFFFNVVGDMPTAVIVKKHTKQIWLFPTLVCWSFCFVCFSRKSQHKQIQSIPKMTETTADFSDGKVKSTELQTRFPWIHMIWCSPKMRPGKQFFCFCPSESCFLSSDLHNWDECPGGCAPIRHPPPPLWPPGRWCYAPTLRSHWYPFLCWRHYAAQTGGGGGVTEENRVLNTIYGILIWFWLFQAWIVDKKWKKKNHTDLSDSLQEKRNALITEKDHGGHMWRK